MIKGFSDFSLDAPGCHPGVIAYKAYFKLNTDVSDLFPFINATAENASYHEKPHCIQFALNGRRIALYPDEVHIAMFENRHQALEFFETFSEFLNTIEAKKDSIEPNYRKYKPVPVFDIFKLLPRTNCKKCGYLTCMAFAAALSKKEADLDQCPDLNTRGNKATDTLHAMGI
jgi:ArsR family metal-binding transcriptional regulator